MPESVAVLAGWWAQAEMKAINTKGNNFFNITILHKNYDFDSKIKTKSRGFRRPLGSIRQCVVIQGNYLAAQDGFVPRQVKAVTTR